MYRHLVLGGTFDGLHKGHRYFLNQACEAADHITIGLTSDAYVRRFKKDSVVTPFSRRLSVLTAWIAECGLVDRVIIVPLDNAWGSAVLGGFDAIAVTRDNKSNADKINILRKERGIPPLSLVEIGLIDAFDETPISSTRIRRGEIDTEGRLVLPDALRPELQKPLGIVLSNGEVKEALKSAKGKTIITVGDVTTDVVIRLGVVPSFAIIDLLVRRKPYQTIDAFGFIKEAVFTHVASGPGFISQSAIDEIRLWAKKPTKTKTTVLIVDGEEDLLVLPVILHAPVGSIIYYGHPPVTGVEGLVCVEVTEKKKQETKLLLDRFIR